MTASRWSEHGDQDQPGTRRAKLRACDLLLDALVITADTCTSWTSDPLAVAMRQLLDGDILTVVRRGDHVSVDPTPLIYGALELLHLLVRSTAAASDVEPLDVVAEMREYVRDWRSAAEL